MKDINRSVDYRQIRRNHSFQRSQKNSDSHAKLRLTTDRSAASVSPTPVQLAQIRQFTVKNIVNSCNKIETEEHFENKQIFRELDKEWILGDLRHQKLKRMY